MKISLLVEIEGEEADCFTQIPVYLLRLLESDNKKTKVQFQANKQTGAFQVITVAPGATISTYQCIHQFYALDTCHTKSQFPIILIIAVSINTNDQVVPLV